MFATAISESFSITSCVRIWGKQGRRMSDWSEGEIRCLAVETLGERYRRYRLPDAAAEAAMVGSLARYGQISPVVVCLREETPELLDGLSG